MNLSNEFTRSGDLWRTAAVQASGIYKGRLGSQQDFNVMGDYLLEISEIEKKAFKDLSKNKLAIMQSPAIKIEHINFHYKDQTQLFNDLNLNVEQGEPFWFVRPETVPAKQH